MCGAPPCAPPSGCDAGRDATPGASTTQRRYSSLVNPTHPRRPQPQGQFEEFQASILFGPRCQVARPVRERLLLVLPDGELHEYVCRDCGTQLGKRRITADAPPVLLAP